jgi:hypothetical protein
MISDIDQSKAAESKNAADQMAVILPLGRPTISMSNAILDICINELII